MCVDAHQAQAEELQGITTKLADFEDHSHRKQPQNRGIPESISSAELTTYLQLFFRTLPPSLTDLDLIIIWAHMIFKPSYVSEDKPRDVFSFLHFYQAKECILLEARKAPTFSEPFTSLKIYADITAATA